MKLAIISFTKDGAQLARRLTGTLELLGHSVRGGYKGRFTADELVEDVTNESSIPLEKIDKTLDLWTKEAFSSQDALIFVGAAGIAVRAIAPYVKGKDVDPAVIVIDETGSFVVPILSGHIGGANRLAQEVAEKIGAMAVLTTATDMRGKFAVDSFAVERNLIIDRVEVIKDVSSAILAGNTVGLCGTIPIEGDIPPELKKFALPERNDEEKQAEAKNVLAQVGILIWGEKFPVPCLFNQQITLTAKNLVLGIGCRRGTPGEKIENIVNKVMEENSLRFASVEGIATINLKADENGLLEFKRAKNLPLSIYTAEELKAVPGEFTTSPFVKTVTGVDNVCERAALRLALERYQKSGSANYGGAGQDPRLIVKKTAREGVTVAVAKVPVVIKI